MLSSADSGASSLFDGGANTGERRAVSQTVGINSPRIFIVAAIVGLVSGLICVLFRFGLRLLQWLVTGSGGLLADAAGHLPLWRRALTPILGAVAATLILRWSSAVLRSARSVDYVEAVRFFEGHIPFWPTFWKSISSAMSIASGAAIGREGSMIQFAAASVATLGPLWKQRSVSSERLIALSVAAAVAAVYQAPLAGVFFAVEIVLGLRAASRESLLHLPALLVAAAGGAFVSGIFLERGPLFAVHFGVHLSWHDTLPALVAAILVGSLAPLYITVIEGPQFMRKLPWPLIWSAAVVGVLSCLRPEVWGNGDSGEVELLNSNTSLQLAATLLLLRVSATSACVGSGIMGGVFTPTVFAGSALGLIYGYGVHRFLSPEFSSQCASPVGFAVLGIGSLLASVTHAPLMAALMTVELTGTWNCFPVVLLGSLLSFEVARMISPKSLYSVATPDPGKVEGASDGNDGSR